MHPFVGLEYRDGMSMPGQAEITAPDPRANQKARTRAALVSAAAELLRRNGVPPTVAEAAEHARVSRTTAYRYFPSQDLLLMEIASLAPAVAPVEAVVAGLRDGTAEQRLLRLVDAFNPVVFAEQPAMRTALRGFLDTWFEERRTGEEAPVVREGRRMRWLDAALAPLRAELKEAEWRRLRAALALTMGVEALVVMKDVCRLDDAEALETLRWAAGALLAAARRPPAE